MAKKSGAGNQTPPTKPRVIPFQIRMADSKKDPLNSEQVRSTRDREASNRLLRFGTRRKKTFKFFRFHSRILRMFRLIPVLVLSLGGNANCFAQESETGSEGKPLPCPIPLELNAKRVSAHIDVSGCGNMKIRLKSYGMATALKHATGYYCLMDFEPEHKRDLDFKNLKTDLFACVKHVRDQCHPKDIRSTYKKLFGISCGRVGGYRYWSDVGDIQDLPKGYESDQKNNGVPPAKNPAGKQGGSPAKGN